MTHPTSGLAALCSVLRSDLLSAGYTVEGIAGALGPDAVSALARSDVAAIRRAAVSAGVIGTLTRLFILRDELPAGVVLAALPSMDLAAALESGLLRRSPDHPDSLRAELDLRPMDSGHGCRWILSDIDGSMVPVATRPDHVLGVGQATLSLLSVTPDSEVGSLLDLGTGCGVHLVHGLSRAGSATGTDIAQRCLDLAAATLAINGLEAELLPGPWFEPVAGRRFDRIVANPPFVVGTDEVGHRYRESGLALDGASRTVVSGAPEHLTEGGTAISLASWVHRRDEDWRTRVASWVPADGVDAWFVQRDVSDPALHVWTWLSDEGMDLREPAAATAADRWRDHLDSHGVLAIGFGYVFLRRISGPSSVLCEDLTHPFGSGLGDEAEAYFARTAWLRGAAERHGSEAAALDSAVLRIAPDVLLHSSVELSTPDDTEAAAEPPVSRGLVVERTSGPRWRHEVDDTVRMILLGIRAAVLPLESVVALVAAAHGIEPGPLSVATRSVVLDLFHHGIVVPVEPVP